jgi:hypothetical protein
MRQYKLDIVKDLVRQAIREKYSGEPATRREALQSIAGLWKDRLDITDSTAYVRAWRKDNRLERIGRSTRSAARL